jgi:aspartate/methionine/tyrosine aminotransferase
VDTPIQHAASELLGTRKAIQPQIIDRLRSNLTAADRHLGGCVRRLQVDGGWYVIFQLPCSRTDEEWAGLLLDDADVYIHPGHFYDFSSDGYLVASLIVEEATFVTAVERLVRTVNENSR